MFFLIKKHGRIEIVQKKQKNEANNLKKLTKSEKNRVEKDTLKNIK